MSTAAPTPAAPAAPRRNRLGLAVADYRGGKTTLCAGCGHNAISERLLEAYFEMGVPPERVAKFSGIGCSSKSPAYFMSRSHAFNAVHGRMPAVATGALLANRHLSILGVSGDGDTASIGIGQFAHLMRRNLPMVYVIEDNGVYGLTKGQFSATADVGATLKTGVVNELPPIDTCALAIELGASFVGRSFSGDKKQLSAMLKAAIAHRGTAMLDVVSPCVTFNDHEGSTKSYQFMKDHDAPLQELSFVPAYQDIAVDYDPGTVKEVALHDGSRLRLRKLEEDYDPTDRAAALKRLAESRVREEVLTGVFFVDPEAATLLDMLDLAEPPLATLPEAAVRPPREALARIMDELR
ncbi:MAG TPA: 2-oxoacid:ferredoxin oxidoreductase subunit beta [Anaeromyxobacteraceae bacterium]|nr:2-oxoacid:ferredoxin oxidoreductase subunit beta [Anaeromyxobacteraceae bacterium]